jgi:hypothetical protein
MTPRTDLLYYLCTVYTAHPRGMVVAYQEACEIAGKLLQQGVKTFCPIAHGHSLNAYMDIAPDDHEFWMGVDKFYIDQCNALLVACMDNWENSRGIAEEIEHAGLTGKKVFYLDPKTLELYSGRREAMEYTG